MSKTIVSFVRQCLNASDKINYITHEIINSPIDKKLISLYITQVRFMLNILEEQLKLQNGDDEREALKSIQAEHTRLKELNWELIKSLESIKSVCDGRHFTISQAGERHLKKMIDWAIKTWGEGV